MRLVWLTTVLALAAGAGTAAPWQIRYAMLPDQTAEWTKQGRIPGWTIAVSDDGDAVSLGGDAQGAFRGYVLLGRPWVVPATRAAEFSLEYQTYCKITTEQMKRSGEWRLMIFSLAGWEALAREPAQARKLGDYPPTARALWETLVHPNGEDVTDWRPWRQTVRLGDLHRRAGETVILAAVWAAYHFEEEWAKLRNLEARPADLQVPRTDILSHLDLSRPDLQAVKAALEQGDVPAARAAFVAHMRARTTPTLPPQPQDAPAGVRKQADDTLAHVFTLASCPPTELGPEIDWGADPHDYDQWPIALNRHTHWLTLGRAYAATKEEKYAQEFVSQLRSWVAALPIYIGPGYIEGPVIEPGKHHLSLDAGIRMAQSWWQAYGYFKDSPSFDVDAQMLMFGSFYDHATYLLDPRVWHPESNWGAMEVNGLFTLAVMLPEVKDAPQWLETARRRLSEALAAQVYPDGAQVELSPGYHGVTLGNFVGALELARLNEVALPADFQAGLERMYEYYVAIAMPDRRMPAVNDSGWHGVEGMLRQGLTLFPRRDDWRYLATGGKEGTPPARTSWTLPYAGFHMMRTGWTPQDKYLFFETGPYSTGHQHEDQLNLIVHVGGKTLLTEGGVYSYDRSAWRRYVLSSRAHNVVLVDGQEQNRGRRRETYRTDKPYESRWFTNSEFDFAQGVYDSGFGPGGEVQVTQTRQVLFVKPDYWLVVDDFVPADDKPHTYEALFHLEAATAQVDEATSAVTVEEGGAGLRIIPLARQRPQVTIVQGQQEPVVQGWLPTGKHNVLRPIPTAVFRWQATGRTRMVYALVPGEGGRWPLASATGRAEGVVVSLTAGGNDCLEWDGPAGALVLTRTPRPGAPAERVFTLR